MIGKQDVDKGSNAGTKQGGGGGHAIADNERNGDCCGHDSQNLLEAENNELREFGSVINLIDEFHVKILLFGDLSYLTAICL